MYYAECLIYLNLKKGFRLLSHNTHWIDIFRHVVEHTIFRVCFLLLRRLLSVASNRIGLNGNYDLMVNIVKFKCNCRPSDVTQTSQLNNSYIVLILRKSVS